MLNSIYAQAAYAGVLFGIAFLFFAFLFLHLVQSERCEQYYVRAPFLIGAILPSGLLMLNIFRESSELGALELFFLLGSSYIVTTFCSFALGLWFKRIRRLNEEKQDCECK